MYLYAQLSKRGIFTMKNEYATPLQEVHTHCSSICAASSLKRELLIDAEDDWTRGRT